MTQPIEGNTEASRLRELARELGRKGGQAGTGAKKKRTAEHYARLARLGVEARAKKRAKTQEPLR